MADRSRQPAVLLRRAERAEALLAAEKEAHAKTFAAMRESMWAAVVMKQKLARLQAVMNGEDDE